jgi:ribulose-bisphosphate carboxylase large chain
MYDETNNIRSPHPQRFWVDYILEATTIENARQTAREICLEQTVELPESISDVRRVEPFTVGTIEHVECIHRPNDKVVVWKVTIAYPNHTAGGELPQFLNVVFGNTSLKHGVAVQNVTLSKHLMENRDMFPGPRFGIVGLRKLLNVGEGPLLCTALKPMGKSSEELAEMAYSFARGGIDIVKVSQVILFVWFV